MSAIGTKQTLMPTTSMFASGGKADIRDPLSNVERTLSVMPRWLLWRGISPVNREGQHQLRQVMLREAGTILDANITGPWRTLGTERERSEQPVPTGEKKPEVHVPLTSPINVVKPVHRPDCQEFLKGPERVVDVGVLYQKLHGNCEGKQNGHFDRQADQDEWQCADGKIEQLMQRVPHQAIEAVESMYAMMHRMQPPQPAYTMTQIMDHRQAEIGDDDCKQQLHADWKVQRPDAPPRHQHADKRQLQNGDDIRDLVDHAVGNILAGVGVCVVPRLFEGQDPFCHKGQRESGSEQNGDPQVRRASRNQINGEKVEPDNHRWHIAEPGK